MPFIIGQSLIFLRWQCLHYLFPSFPKGMIAVQCYQPNHILGRSTASSCTSIASFTCYGLATAISNSAVALSMVNLLGSAPALWVQGGVSSPDQGLSRPEKAQADLGRTHKLHTNSCPGQESNIFLINFITKWLNEKTSVRSSCNQSLFYCTLTGSHTESLPRNIF